MPGSKSFLRKDKHGVDVWRMEVFLGAGPDGKPDRRRREFHGTGAECEKALALFYAEMVQRKAKEEFAATHMTVAQWAEEWLQLLQRYGRKASYVRHCRDRLHNRILPALGAHQLADLTPRHIAGWLRQMQSQRCFPRQVKSQNLKSKIQNPKLLSASHIAGHFRVLRAMLQEAVYQFHIPDNPARKVRAPRSETPEMAAYTAEELAPVIRALERYDTSFRALVLLGLTTGARRGELIGLDWPHVDLPAARLTIAHAAITETGVPQYLDRTKSPRSVRTLPLTPDMVELLTAWKAEQAAQRAAMGEKWQGADFVFTTRHGTWINVDYADRKIARFVKRHNLPRIHLHGLRHTVATTLLANGLPLADTSAHLGHAQQSTTLIYTHALASRQSRAAEILSTLPPKIPPTTAPSPSTEHTPPDQPDPS